MTRLIFSTRTILALWLGMLCISPINAYTARSNNDFTSQISGIVTDPDGHPIQGASVKIEEFYFGHIETPDSFAPILDYCEYWATTDKEGKFLFENLSKASFYKLTCESAEWGKWVMGRISLVNGSKYYVIEYSKPTPVIVTLNQRGNSPESLTRPFSGRVPRPPFTWTLTGSTILPASADGKR